ncbi:hypothetical protein QN413_25680, partial [Variovorax sp. LG9.2]|nr:hypothetical protein [Variovorax sp. LG9.2]
GRPRNLVFSCMHEACPDRSIDQRLPSVAELELAIDLYVPHHNVKPKPFIWTATATDILAKVPRDKTTLAQRFE